MPIRIDELSPTALPSRDHVVPAMKDGLTVMLEVGQIADVAKVTVAETYDPNGKETDAFDTANHAYNNSTSGLAAESAQDAIDELAARLTFMP
jgi:hypothetical protein